MTKDLITKNRRALKLLRRSYESKKPRAYMDRKGEKVYGLYDCPLCTISLDAQQGCCGGCVWTGMSPSGSHFQCEAWAEWNFFPGAIAGLKDKTKLKFPDLLKKRLDHMDEQEKWLDEQERLLNDA